MKFYAVCTMATNVNGKLHFQLSAAEVLQVKETDKYVSWKGTRLDKEQIGKIKPLYDTHSITGFRVFVWEDQLPAVKTEIVEFTRNHIENRIKDYLSIQEVVGGTPEYVEEVWR